MQLTAKTRTKKVFRVIKWDEPKPELVPVGIDHPEKDPRCAEIIEWEMGGPQKTIYKRD